MTKVGIKLLDMDKKVVCRKIIDRLIDLPKPTKKIVDKIKTEICQQEHVSMPSNSTILQFINDEEKEKLDGQQGDIARRFIAMCMMVGSIWSIICWGV